VDSKNQGCKISCEFRKSEHKIATTSTAFALHSFVFKESDSSFEIIIHLNNVKGETSLQNSFHDVNPIDISKSISNQLPTIVDSIDKAPKSVSTKML